MLLPTIATLCGIIPGTIAAPGNGINNLPPSQSDPTLLDTSSDSLHGIAKTVNNGPPTHNGSPFKGSDTGPWPGYSSVPVSSELSFYMCCLQGPASTGIELYYPPYACIFGPATGACPQGATSSFRYAWLCTYQTGEIGNIDCTYESGPASSSVIAGIATVLNPVLNAAGNILGGIGL
ncbi:hypothetical protein N7481_011941 [Penicillium waksmanii]|uniref:uncharacterized protein n=1 Tax=Penicillium waksmanii TaxID=69791 RepID=UPI0025489AA7|nr:uncharacterized protein N7481_011941 [Penicillium waksmanii]KAJ5974731.1 hypothetical protein N7481_011941 [Penicillium waksmanii]